MGVLRVSANRLVFGSNQLTIGPFLGSGAGTV